MSKVEDVLLDELMKATKKSEPTKKKAIRKPKTFKSKKVEVKVGDGQTTFSELVGVESHSKVDHAVTCYKAEDWPEVMREYIPPIEKFKNYVPQTRELEDLLVAWEMGDRVNVVGPTGSGKSSMVEYACALTGRPFIRINGRGDMESSSLLGMLTVKDGDTIWMDGELTMGVRQGAVVCVDEWTLIPPEITMSLQWLMEDGGKLLLSDMPADAGERMVTPPDTFRLVCTDNTRGLGDESGGFAATNVQNTATLDRFGTIIHVDYLDRKHETAVLKNMYPELTNYLCEDMLKFAKLVRDAYEKNEISLTCSPRTLLNWAKKAQYFKDEGRALRMCFFEKIGSDGERSAVAAMYRTVFDKSL